MPHVPAGGLGQAVKCGQARKGQHSLIYPMRNNILVNGTFFNQKDISAVGIDSASDPVEQLFHSCSILQVEQDDINSPRTPVLTNQMGV